jgi:pimeloyl-ACP methyl ester carboxylesterase
MTDTSLRPFRVTVAPEDITDLRDRLARTRWPDQLPGSGWTLGTDRSYLQALCRHWAEAFDWSLFEERFNRFAQFVTDIEGQSLHFFHVRSPEPDALPLLISHGWPGSVAEFLDVLGPLSDPRAHGADGADAFHVVAPSLPGYGFSGPTNRAGVDIAQIAEWFDVLMTRLGYDRYVAQGGDWGALITARLGADHSNHVMGIHLNMLPVEPPPREERLTGVSEDERAGLERNRRFRQEETGYQAIQSTKPQTLAYGLNDSPAGLAAWIVEKFRTWSDCDGDVERSFTKDRLLDNISVYWLTGTIGSSVRLYQENPPGHFPAVTVPTGHSSFPGEIYQVPRAWAERRYRITSWTTPARGGHFAAMEVPDLFVDEVRTYFRALRA